MVLFFDVFLCLDIDFGGNMKLVFIWKYWKEYVIFYVVLGWNFFGGVWYFIEGFMVILS